MRSTYSNAMRRGVFPHEGGYGNHPSDPGGPTNWGITIIDARKYWKPDATAADVRQMPKEVAEDIYRKHYAAPLRYDDLPAGLDYCVLDYGINSGIGRSGKVLRRVLGLPDNTWQVTDDVLRAVAKREPKALINAICDERLRFLQNLKTWPVFGAGWSRRVAEVRTLALNFAAEPVSSNVSNIPAPGKGAVPINTKAQKGTAAGAIVSAGTAVTQGFQAGLKPAAIVLFIIVPFIAIGMVGWAWWLWHRDVQQDAPIPAPIVPERGAA